MTEFLRKARKKKWVKELEGVSLKGKTVLTVDATIVEAGRLLLGRKGRKSKLDGLLTVVRSIDGAIQSEHEPEASERALAKTDADKAVTTRRPTLCCPYPVEGPDVRASEVLAAFCTPSQWEEWERFGRLHCHGNLSGHRYRIAHRHSELAREQGKVGWDETDDIVVHCYDWSVPPAEEALAIKLALEHREHWIRNRSGMLTPRARNVYNNPFMSDDSQHLDGVVDSAIVQSLGPVVAAIKEILDD